MGFLFLKKGGGGGGGRNGAKSTVGGGLKKCTGCQPTAAMEPMTFGWV